ncbi:MAG: low molecular weight phosphotyrosine protein phosphatase [Phycisphaerales bacterium]|nr:low molecular weight phosphotyrosine protein phosphatase [Phycisphaerales bacterium]
MGNICRSPAAEAVFREKAAGRGLLKHLSIDSCGTGGWHAGERADARMRSAARDRDVEISSRARQICQEDLSSFDYILCMDGDNFAHVRSMGGDDRVRRMLEFHPSGGDVPDPYYGGADGFETVLNLLDVACSGLLDEIDTRHGLSS